MNIFRRIFAWMSSLKVAIVLLIIIAISSSLGTTIPQNEPKEVYLETYNNNLWLGILNGESILKVGLDHIYSSLWFLLLLLWLGFALMICSFRRQWPNLKSTIKWIDYTEPKQISKLAVAETIEVNSKNIMIDKISKYLLDDGWDVKVQENRLAARKGTIGRIGPLLVHAGLILLLIGAVWGSLDGQKVERFLVPGRSFKLLNQSGRNQLEMTLEKFTIERDPAGRAEQFRSEIKFYDPEIETITTKDISVNNPFRYKGMTVYQADWSLAAITVQFNSSPKLQLPLIKYPELGEDVFGIALPTEKDGSEPVLLTLTSEQGPIKAYDKNGIFLKSIRPGSGSILSNKNELKVINIIPASGLLLKRDPGVPLVYSGFAITLIGGALSIIATRQIWALIDPSHPYIHIGGLCNRNLAGLSKDLPILVSEISNN